MIKPAAEQDPALLPFLSLYLNAYAELEDALRWTANLPPTIDVEGSLEAYRPRILAALQSVPIQRQAAKNTVCEALDDCRDAQAFHRRVRDEPFLIQDNLLPPTAIKLREEARKLYRLTMRVLELHVMFRRGSREDLYLAVQQPMTRLYQ
jgi:hypothetical protein